MEVDSCAADGPPIPGAGSAQMAILGTREKSLASKSLPVIADK
jgi:hypothetical protein